MRAMFTERNNGSTQGLPQLQEQGPESKVHLTVKAQKKHGGATHIRKPKYMRSLVAKVFEPLVSARIEQARDHTSIGIKARKVRPFDGIAPTASEGEIFITAGATVLLGDNVFRMEWHAIFDDLQEAAIFAAVARPHPDSLAEFSVHVLGSGALQEQTRLQFQNRHHAARIDVAPILLFFIERQLALIRLCGELLNADRLLGIGGNTDEIGRCLCCETRFGGLKEMLKFGEGIHDNTSVSYLPRFAKGQIVAHQQPTNLIQP